jgi:hypothetical protein
MSKTGAPDGDAVSEWIVDGNDFRALLNAHLDGTLLAERGEIEEAIVLLSVHVLDESEGLVQL